MALKGGRSVKVIQTERERLKRYSPLYMMLKDAGYSDVDIGTTLGINVKHIPESIKRPERNLTVNQIVLVAHLLGLSFTETMSIVCRAKLSYTNRAFYEMDDHISKGGK